MTVAPANINQIFHTHHLPHIHLETRNPVLRLLDHKVSSFALNFFQQASAKIGAATVIVACIISGIGSVPWMFVGGCLAVYSICRFVKQKMYMLFSSKKLKEHQRKAEALVMSHKYLSEVARLGEAQEDKIIKNHFVRPLTSLITKYSAADLVKYKILSEDLLLQAFLLETQYQDFAQSLALFKKLDKALQNHRNAYPDFTTKIQQRMQEKALEHKEALKSKLETLPEGKFSKLYLFHEELSKDLKILTEAIDNGFLLNNSQLVQDCKSFVKEFSKVCKITKKDFTPIKNVLDLLKASQVYYSKMYQGNELHETIESKQREFITSLELIYMNKQEKEEKIFQEFKENTQPIEARKIGDAFEEEDRKLHDFFDSRKKMKLQSCLEYAQIEMQTLVERFTGDDLDYINTQLIQDYQKIQQQQDGYNQPLHEKLAQLDAQILSKYHSIIENLKTVTNRIKQKMDA